MFVSCLLCCSFFCECKMLMLMHHSDRVIDDMIISSLTLGLLLYFFVEGFSVWGVKRRSESNTGEMLLGLLTNCQLLQVIQAADGFFF